MTSFRSAASRVTSMTLTFSSHAAPMMTGASRDNIVRISAGDCHVATDGEAIATTLGSCISACVRDRETGFGGMNHFMLPKVAVASHEQDFGELRYGVHAMEFLINEVLRLCNERRDRLEVKLVGGGELLGGASSVGNRNADFARCVVRDAGLPVVAEDLGGAHGRRVVFLPETGQLFVKHLSSAVLLDVSASEERYQQRIDSDSSSCGDVELF